MIIALFIFLLSIIIELLTIGFLLSKIEININNLEITRKNNKFYLEDFRGNINIYVFRNLKSFNIKIYKSYFKFLGIKMPYNKFFKLYRYKTIDEIIIKNFEKIKKYLKDLFNKKINLDIEKIKLNIDVGTENSLLTSILVALLSIVIPIIIRNQIDEYNIQKFNYKVSPNYFNINNIKIKIEMIFYIETYNLIEEINLNK